MLRVVARRLATGALTLLLVTLLVFLLIQIAPGSPLAEAMDTPGLPRLSPETMRAMQETYRLDQPLHRQYLLWLGDLARGDLGRSFHDRRKVTEKIGDRLAVSLTLNAFSLLLMVALAIPIGAAAAFGRGSRWDRFAGSATYMLYAVPTFWAGLLLQILFAVRLGWLPLAGLRSDGWERLGPFGQVGDFAAHLLLPVLCLTYPGLAYLSRFVRATLIENASVESSVAARARGLSGIAVLYRHGFRLAAVPMLTLAGFLLPALVGGSVIVERVFSIPGLGGLFVESAFRRDMPVLLGLTLLSGAATLAGVLLADVAYAVADPRVRRG